MEQGCCTMRDIKWSKRTTTGLMKKWPPGEMGVGVASKVESVLLMILHRETAVNRWHYKNCTNLVFFFSFQGNLVHSSLIPHHWIGWASCDWQLSAPVVELWTFVSVFVPSCYPTLQTGRSTGDIWNGKRRDDTAIGMKIYSCGNTPKMQQWSKKV